MGRTNYAACIGDAVDFLADGAYESDLERVGYRAEFIRASGRGVFVTRERMKFRDVLDGLSNTIAAGEIATDLGDRDKKTLVRTNGSNFSGIRETPLLCRGDIDAERPQFWDSSVTSLGASNQGRGFRWASGTATYSSMNTILPPNAELCVTFSDTGQGMLPPSSRHQGGVHILMTDGAIKFITDSVDTGDLTAETISSNNSPGSASPYGLWGATGTRASKEVEILEF